MDKRQLEYFVHVSEFQSFTKAAKELQIAQSAISIKLNKLEAELGTLLLNRKSRKVTLTKDGQLLYLKARKILDLFEETTSEIKELQGMNKGHTRLGLSNALSSFYFPEILMKFMNQYPHIKITAIAHGTNDIHKKLIDEELDMGFIITEKTDTDIEVQNILNDELKVCVSKDHPWAKAPFIKHEDFAKEKLIMYSEGFYARDRLFKQLRGLHLKENIHMETNLSHLVQHMVSKNIGVTVFAGFLAKHLEQLVSIPLNPPITYKWGVARKKNVHLSKASQTFLDFFVEEIKNSIALE